MICMHIIHAYDKAECPVCIPMPGFWMEKNEVDRQEKQ